MLTHLLSMLMIFPSFCLLHIRRHLYNCPVFLSSGGPPGTSKCPTLNSCPIFNTFNNEFIFLLKPVVLLYPWIVSPSSFSVTQARKETWTPLPSPTSASNLLPDPINYASKFLLTATTLNLTASLILATTLSHSNSCLKFCFLLQSLFYNS